MQQAVVAAEPGRADAVVADIEAAIPKITLVATRMRVVRENLRPAVEAGQCDMVNAIATQLDLRFFIGTLAETSSGK